MNRIPKTLQEVKDTFLRTFNKTPGGGETYVHPTEDMCATVYGDKARVYWDRKPEFRNKIQVPFMYRRGVEVK